MRKLVGDCLICLNRDPPTLRSDGQVLGGFQGLRL